MSLGEIDKLYMQVICPALVARQTTSGSGQTPCWLPPCGECLVSF